MKNIILSALCLISIYAQNSQAHGLGCDSEETKKSPLCIAVAAPWYVIGPIFVATDLIYDQTVVMNLRKIGIQKRVKFNYFGVTQASYSLKDNASSFILSMELVDTLEEAVGFCEKNQGRLAQLKDLKVLEAAAAIDLELMNSMVYRLYKNNELSEVGFMGWNGNGNGKEIFSSVGFKADNIQYSSYSHFQYNLSQNHSINYDSESGLIHPLCVVK